MKFYNPPVGAERPARSTGGRGDRRPGPPDLLSGPVWADFAMPTCADGPVQLELAAPD